MATIALIGAGRIGGNLARRWAAAGHGITLGARDPSKPALLELAEEIGGWTAETAEAVTRSEVAVFAIPGDAMAETVAQLGSRLDGRVVIDASNNVRGERAHSRAEIAAAAPRAHYARAFNSYGWEMIDNPVVAGVQADAFHCCPDGDPRATVAGLITDVGLHPVWLGGPDQVEVVDGVLRLWFRLVMGQGHSRRLALKLLEE